MLIVYQVLSGCGLIADATYEPHFIAWYPPDAHFSVWMVPGTFDDEGRLKRRFSVQ